MGTYRGLLLHVGDLAVALPVDAVERVIGVPRAHAATMLARGMIDLGDQVLPFGSLAAILATPAEGDAAAAATELPCIVIRMRQGCGVVQVDRIGGVHEILIKELRPPLRRVPCVTSAGLLATGLLVLVLRPGEVLDSIVAGPGPERVSVPERKRLKILVVDDSITTRMMESNLFEAAGYEVRTAADGVDAWNLLQHESIDIVVSDVDMPLMDGFVLTERIRADAKLQYLPVILVTAMEAREDKDRGIQVGANAYVLKSSFDQSTLLDIVGRLV